MKNERLSSERDIYVAACGWQFTTHDLGRRHERECYACSQRDIIPVRVVFAAVCGREFDSRTEANQHEVACNKCRDQENLTNAMSSGNPGDVLDAANAISSRTLTEIRDDFLHDPDHDIDTINWALRIIDRHL